MAEVTYTPPGVRERKIEREIAPQAIASQDIIALVSEVPKNRTFTEGAVRLTGTDEIDLVKEGIEAATIRVYSRTGTVEYAASDYTVVQTETGAGDTQKSRYALTRVNRNATETFTLESGVSVYRPVNGRGVHNIRVRTLSPAQEYTELVDWVYDPYTNRLTALASGSMPRQGETITLSYDYGIEDGETVQVRYRYADKDYYAPFVAVSAQDVARRYGDAFDDEDRVNPMTLAAEVMFANASSAVQVRCIPVNPVLTGSKTIASLADWQVAIEGISERDVGIICETSGLLDVQFSVIQHVRQSYNENISMMTFLGRDGTKEPLVTSGGNADEDRVTRISLREYAKAVAYERAVIVSTPTCDGTVGVNSSASGERTLVGNQYLACAIAALAVSGRPETPLTRKSLATFRVAASVAESFLVGDTASGLMVVDSSGGLPKIKHGITTKFSDIYASEVSVIRVQDFLLKSLKTSLDDNIIGRVQDENIEFLVSSVVMNILERFKNAGAIVDYTSPEVAQDTSDPTMLRVAFTYNPTLPVNRILIEYGISSEGGTQILRTSQG